MSNPKWTVHINTAQKRKRHAASDNLVRTARVMASGKQVSGYAIMTWDSEGVAVSSSYDPGGIPSRCVPELVRVALEGRVNHDLGGLSWQLTQLPSASQP